jgi:hypothetical protein
LHVADRPHATECRSDRHHRTALTETRNRRTASRTGCAQRTASVVVVLRRCPARHPAVRQMSCPTPRASCLTHAPPRPFWPAGR